ncbi:NAD(P)-dependent oxidoreductase [Marinitenerispora sediminis]|uniref:6-phosphogluconate dehydrogenase n=1 Tax=Marinitenerispora sediminis TaxID=1931232 RepID=A0A368T6S8_9ACTN|nr:NAD(P)-binding domain-containing protein [Marinitenerispora sediminis]RCV50658.1 6-phosphogluconate dehydrogenase [Marinitenerispora sediminis]RCV56200.1 6-phosphogluconate dehydrogenase [Marinitenerispora sediminis]RCV59431.1 6-phosphogluconate dehydrogenase [Marinitenerispora sediminis]
MGKQAVTVIGLGPMGQAMARTFLANGHPVTVWNRTASRADELVAAGAVRAATVRDALAANELVVLSLTDHDAMYAILEPAADALAGRVLVNLSSDTPERSRAAAAWATGLGARYLTGGVQSSPSGIGKPESATFYSGPEEVLQAHRETLSVLTGTDYVGTDPGLASLYYQLQMDMFWTSMLSYLHALAVADANGISAQEFLPHATATAASIPDFLAFYAPRVDAGNHAGDVDRLAMGVASVEHVLHTAEAAGVDTALPGAVLEVFRRGTAAGRGGDSFSSLFEVMRKGAS